jgi:hypothetical protein
MKHILKWIRIAAPFLDIFRTVLVVATFFASVQLGELKGRHVSAAPDHAPTTPSEMQRIERGWTPSLAPEVTRT